MISFLATAAILAQAQAPTYTVIPAGTIYGQEALCFAFAPTGPLFAAGMADMSVKVFDSNTRQVMHTFTGHRLPCRAIAWNPQGDRIASGSENAEIRVWHVKSGAFFSLRGHDRNIQALAFSRDGKRLVSTSDDDTIKVWDLAKRKSVLTVRGKGVNVYGAKFDKSGRRIIAATLGAGMSVYNAGTGALVKSYGGHSGTGVNEADINDAYTRAVTAGRDSNLAVWDLKTAKRISYLRGHSDWVVHADLSPDNRLCASSSSDGTARIWDIVALKPVAKLEDLSYTGSPLAWGKVGGYLAAVGSDNTIRLFYVEKKLPAKKKAGKKRRRA